MNDEVSACEPTDPASGSASPGRTIRLAREAAGIGLEELAALTKLSPATLVALEGDDFGALHESVYVRGYYRKCAKVLGLDEEPLIQAYQARARPTQPGAPANLRLAPGVDLGTLHSSSGSRLAAVMPALALIICVALWFAYEQRHTPSPVFQSQIGGAAVALEPAPAPLALAPAPSSPAMPPPADAPLAAESAAQSVTPPPLPAAQAAERLDETRRDDTPAAHLAAEGRLVLDFVATSWARIEDRTGRVLLNRLVQAGERQTLFGEPPYSVQLGNAPGVKVEYRGQAIDLQGYVRPNATARFNVPQAS